MRQSNAILFLVLILSVVFSHSALAIMPPAPPEWYTERLKVPIPEGIKNGMPQFNPAIAKDLADAASKRPKNTDKILLILVEFTDNPADQGSHPQSAYDDLMFSTGVLPTGSLLEYYQEISYGQFAPEGNVTAWITAPHTYSYYADDSYGTGDYPNNSQGLLEDCVNILDPLIDFSEYDANGDGYVESIFLVHAGPGAEETGNSADIWSHAWYYEAETDDGVYTGRYSTEPEELFDGQMIKIGVFCHEYGHVLGVPDLYDTDGSSEGIGVYCLMAGGSWGALPGNPERPTHMSAEMKRRLGWMSPIDVVGNLVDLVIPPAATNAVCYRVNHPTAPNEYFLIENRAKIGFDSLFRGDGGLAIWHVDEWGWQQDENHRYVTLEQADGNSDLERDYGTGNRHARTNRGDAGDLFPGATSNGHFSFSTNPSSMSYDLFTDLVTITGIEYYDDSIRASIYVDPDVPIYAIESHTVFDTVASASESNFNSDADSGEVVDLVVKIANDGETATAVTGTISTSDLRVSIIDATADFGQINHGTYGVNNSSPFRFEVLTGSTDSAVTFNLHLDADGDPYDLELKVNINRQKIMLVLDNNESNWSDNLVNAMHRSGYSIDTHTTSAIDYPEYEELIPYHLVLWTTGSYFGRRTSSSHYEYCLNSNEISVLENYLDNAGRLVLFSQDYLYDNGIDPFASNYLHVASMQEDEGGDHIVGDPGSYMSGFDGYSQEWTFYDYTDHITPSAEAEIVLREDSEFGDGVAISYPETSPKIGDFATTFCAYGVERFDSTSLDMFLQQMIPWHLSNTNIDLPLPISPKNGDTVESFMADLLATASVGAAEYEFQIASDPQFGNIEFETSSLVGPEVVTDTLNEGEHFWRVRAVSSGSPIWTSYSPTASFVTVHPCLPGDANGSGDIDIDDVVYLIAYIFSGGPPPDPLEAGDADCSGDIDIDDVVYLIAYIFSGGPAPCAEL
jgi:immune inhibitor A